jgi:hypothetical protein
MSALPFGMSPLVRVRFADRQAVGGPASDTSPASHTPAGPGLLLLLLLAAAAAAELSRMNLPSSCGKLVSSSLVNTYSSIPQSTVTYALEARVLQSSCNLRSKFQGVLLIVMGSSQSASTCCWFEQFPTAVSTQQLIIKLRCSVLQSCISTAVHSLRA